MANINISSNYQYITNAQKSIIESNIPDVLSVIQDNLLDFQLDFSNGTWYLNELKVISNELVDMAKYFIEQQGLIETGRLYEGVHAELQGNKIKFYNNAKNDRNEFYAGHIEYGHRNRDGSFVPAYPFMRPALYSVSQASQGRFANTLSDLASGVFRDNGRGYQGVSNLTFKHSFQQYLKNPSNARTTLSRVESQHTRKGLSEKSKISSKDYMASILHDSQFRQPFSVRRDSSSNINMKHREDLGFGKDGLNTNIKKIFQQKVVNRKRNK